MFYSSFLRREITFVTSCLLHWTKRSFGTWSTVKGKILLQWGHFSFKSYLHSKGRQNKNGEVASPETVPTDPKFALKIISHLETVLGYNNGLSAFYIVFPAISTNGNN